MTYIGRPIAPVKVDFLQVWWTGSLAANPLIITPQGTLGNTRATLSGNQVTLYSGSHWRVEFSPGILEAQIYDKTWPTSIYSVTDATTIGTKGFITLPPPASPTTTSYLTRARPVACALILDSDITTSKVLEFHYENNASGNFLAKTAATGEERFQYNTVRIMELPA